MSWPAKKPAKRKRTTEATFTVPPSIGDTLKDEIRNAQNRPKKLPENSATDEGAVAVSSGYRWETDETVPFPRGGGSALTPLEHRAIATAAKEDASFESRQHGAEAAGPLRTALGGATLVRAHLLSRKQLVVGVRVLAAVSEVSSDRLLMQLPGRISGRVEREEVSDELHAAMQGGTLQAPPDLRKLFRMGEVLCCAVVRTAPVSATFAQGQPAPPVELTLRLSVVQRAALAASPRLRAGSLLWGTLRSNEAYGFVMETATPSGGFLQRKSWPAPLEPARWRPHLCATSSTHVQQPRKPLQLTATGPHGAAPRALAHDTVLKFEGLLPGMRPSAEGRGVAPTLFFEAPRPGCVALYGRYACGRPGRGSARQRRSVGLLWLL